MLLAHHEMGLFQALALLPGAFALASAWLLARRAPSEPDQGERR